MSELSHEVEVTHVFIAKTKLPRSNYDEAPNGKPNATPNQVIYAFETGEALDMIEILEGASEIKQLTLVEDA
jgi:hypothetical protein